MPGTVSRKHAIAPLCSPGLRQARIRTTAAQRSDLKGSLAHTGENWAGQATFRQKPSSPFAPPPARPPAAAAVPPVREAAAVLGSKPPVFSRSSVHPCGLMQAWALWPAFCVCVCSCCSCPLCEARLWHPVPFPRCLSVWSPANLGRLCITAA